MWDMDRQLGPSPFADNPQQGGLPVSVKRSLQRLVSCNQKTVGNKEQPNVAVPEARRLGSKSCLGHERRQREQENRALPRKERYSFGQTCPGSAAKEQKQGQQDHSAGE
jgi:hypothetical protein